MSPAEISSSYDSSIVVRRWLATWIDFLLLAGFLFLPDALLGNALYQKTLLLWLALIALYYPLLEGLTGTTLGKWIAHVKVVDEQGQTPGIGKAILRTLLRLIEVNPVLAGGLPAGIVVLTSKKRQRLGDMAAQTYVLKTSDLGKLGQPGLPAFPR
jgi:uncharacterized RDD family membrane protein YckC